MSFVGPRPHAVAHNEQYRKLISGYMIRHKVRPGITGWAQVNGLRGETDTLEKMRRRIEYDIDYLNNWSLWLDLKILLRSVPLVLRDKQRLLKPLADSGLLLPAVDFPWDGGLLPQRLPVTLHSLPRGSVR